MPQWEKYLCYDWDPELFVAFLTTFPLNFNDLVENIRFAFNHDTNIEAIIEQGLAKIDDKELRTKKKQQLKLAAVASKHTALLPLYTWLYSADSRNTEAAETAGTIEGLYM